MGVRAEGDCGWIGLGLVAALTALRCTERNVGQRVAGDRSWIDLGLGGAIRTALRSVWGGGLGLRSSSSSGVSGVEPGGALAGRGLVFVGCPLAS